MKTDGRLFWLRATWFLDQLRRVARRRVTAADLAAKFEYSLPSAYRTIDALRNDFGAPIEFDRRRNTWRFSGPYWDLPRIPLSPDEITALALARSLVSHVTAPGLADAMERFWSKFSLDLAQQSPAGAGFTHAVSARTPVWTRVDPDVMESVLRALALDRRLRLLYTSPWTDEVTERTVEPRHLLLYEGSFYLAAHCLLRHGAVRLFHLSAIASASAPVLPEPNSPPAPPVPLGPRAGPPPRPSLRTVQRSRKAPGATHTGRGSPTSRRKGTKAATWSRWPWLMITWSTMSGSTFMASKL